MERANDCSGRVESSEFHSAAQISHTNPYAHSNGISRNIGLSWRQFDQLTADTTELEGDLLRATLEYGYQIAESQSIRLGLALQRTELNTGLLASNQLENWVRNNGDSVLRGNTPSTDFVTADFLFGWNHDTRNKSVFPDAGLEQHLDLKIVAPGSEIEYYTIEYGLSKYWSLNGGWTAKFEGNLGFGARYGSKTTSLVPNLNWFAGGDKFGARVP